MRRAWSSAFGHGGDPVIETPHFDRFAKQGARFTRAYAANPVCTPNRSCLLTGRYAHQHGMIQNNLMLPPGERCLAESFRAAGYATEYIGKWHIDGEDKPGYVPRGWRRRGFETFKGFNRGHWYPTGARYFTDGGRQSRCTPTTKPPPRARERNKKSPRVAARGP
ncbi:MAG: sulfatase-like hydrolase/transferase [Planctomycetaceae bacterium]